MAKRPAASPCGAGMRSGARPSASTCGRRSAGVASAARSSNGWWRRRAPPATARCWATPCRSWSARSPCTKPGLRAHRPLRRGPNPGRHLPAPQTVTVMKADDLVSEIRAYCAAHADPEEGGEWERYFTEGYDAWGLLDKNDPLWNAKQQEWLERYAALGLARLPRSSASSCSPAASTRRARWPSASSSTTATSFDAASFARLGRWFEAGIGNWAHTDVLCGEVIAPLRRAGRVGPRSARPLARIEVQIPAARRAGGHARTAQERTRRAPRCSISSAR